MSGLEALGVAASIIQVADLGTKLSVKLFSFYRRLKNANESIQLLSNEIALVSAILRELGDNLKGGESAQICSDEALRTLTLVLNQCRDVLRLIQKVIDTTDQNGKSRFQQVTGKFRLVLLEPSLDQLKVNLERLKSTMLLLLNVIMYAGQIRRYASTSVPCFYIDSSVCPISNNVPDLVEEQRDLIQSLLDDRNIHDQKSGQMNMASQPSRDLSMETTNTKSAQTKNDGISNQKKVSKNHRPASENQYFEELKDSTDDSEAQSGARIATEGNESTELKEYSLLIQSMLDGIDSCRSKLKETRHSRIKNGVLNIHSGEIMRFQIEHGPSVHIDHSLFACVLFIFLFSS